MAYVCYDFNSAPICDELENFNDMIVRLSKRVNRLDINDFYYYYVIEFINSNTKISYSSQTNDIKNLLLLTSERLRLFETEIQICDM